ncbi:AraC family transcriptional regulator [Evansella sp. AB-rgal1]|uniref:AraC family transcriptional regulator n=1 Tax=Evansella sp. AB-rgal1 TaxID=3242696 RepID=UPI00359E1E3E
MRIVTSVIPPHPVFIKAGKAKFRKGAKHFKRTFHIFDLIYVTKGCVHMKEEEITYDVKEGEYLILTPEKNHYGYKGCMEESEYYWIHFSLSNEYSLIDKNKFDWSDILLKESTFIEPAEFKLHVPTYGSLRNQNRGIEAFAKIVEENESNDPAMKMKQNLSFYELIIQMQQDAIELPSSAQAVTDKVIHYIQTNYWKENFSVKEMARDLLFHPDYVTRSIKKMIGVTPIQYVNYYRLSVAKHKLVQEKHIDLQTLAKECGFKDASYFSRVFKKKEGITPGQYRRMRRSSEE